MCRSITVRRAHPAAICKEHLQVHKKFIDFPRQIAYNESAKRQCEDLFQRVHKSEAPGSGVSRVLLVIYLRLTRPQDVAALLFVHPFADVIRDYTCHDGKGKGEDCFHTHVHLLPLRRSRQQGNYIKLDRLRQVCN